MNTLMFDQYGLKVLQVLANDETAKNLYYDIHIFMSNLFDDKLLIKRGSGNNKDISDILNEAGVKSPIRQKKILANIKAGTAVDLPEEILEKIKAIINDQNSQGVSDYFLFVENSKIPVDFPEERLHKSDKDYYVKLNEMQIELLRDIAKEILEFLDIEISYSVDILSQIKDLKNEILRNNNNKFSTLNIKKKSMVLFGKDVKTIMNYQSTASVIRLIESERPLFLLNDIESFEKMLTSEDDSSIKELFNTISQSSILSSELETFVREIQNIGEESEQYKTALKAFFAGYLQINSSDFFSQLQKKLVPLKIKDLYEFLLNIQELVEFGFTGIGVNLDNLKDVLYSSVLNINYISEQEKEEIENNSNIKFITHVLKPILDSECFW